MRYREKRIRPTMPKADRALLRSMQEYLARVQFGQGTTTVQVNDDLAVSVDDSANNAQATFFPAQAFDVFPGTAANAAPQLQHAIDEVPDGWTLKVNPGEYLLDATLSVRRSNITIWLDPGVRLVGRDIGAVLAVEGAASATASSLSASVVAGQQDGITVASTAAIAAGDWIYLEDTQFPIEGTAIHRELNRVRSITDATHLVLYYPAVDGYTLRTATTDIATDVFTQNAHGLQAGDIITFSSITATTGISTGTNYYVRTAGLTANAFTISTTGAGGAIVDLLTANGSVVIDSITRSGTRRASEVRVVTPAEKVTITGGGRIENTGTSGATGGHGIRVTAAASCSILGIEAADVRNACVAVQYSLGTEIRGNYFHDAPIFNNSGGHGYGITTTGGIATLISGNRLHRLRHLVDVSYWSRQTAVVGNELHAAGFSQMFIHPHTIGTVVVGNTLDGARGFSQPDPATEMADGGSTPAGVSAPAVACREFTKNLLVANNTIQNAALAGISFNENDCENLAFIGNLIRNVNTRDSVSSAGIYCASSTTQSCPNLIVAFNQIDTVKRFGIVMGYSNGVVVGNQIRNLTGTDQIGVLVAARSGSTVGNVQVKDNTIVGGNYGVYVGGTWLSGTGGVTVPNIDGNQIFNPVLSGVYIESFSTGGVVLNAIVQRNEIVDANSGDSTSHGGIVAIETNAGGTTGYGIRISRNRVSGACRNGIMVGLDDGIVEDNILYQITSITPVGLGIFVRALSGSTVTGMRIYGNTVQECTSSGIRIGSDSGAGDVEFCLIEDNYCEDNGINLDEKALCSNNLIRNNDCFDANAPTSYGIYVRGDNTRVFENYCCDRGGGTQDYGIYVETTSDGAVLRNNWAEGNGTADYSFNGTNIRFTDTAGTTQGVADANATVVRPTRVVRYTSITAARVVNLPAANTVDYDLWIEDSSGNCSGANTITPTAAGTDTFDDTGAAAGPALAAAFAVQHIRCVAQGKWKVLSLA